MDAVFDYPLTTIFIVVIVLFVTVRIARVAMRANRTRICARCKTTHPPGAKFCRVCGAALT
jgi:ribosomal protein L40E